MDRQPSHQEGMYQNAYEAAKDNRMAKLEKQRDELLLAAKKTIEENGHLADGDICTLKLLKDAIAEIEAAK